MVVRHVHRPDAIAAAEVARRELEAYGIEVLPENCTDCEVDLVLALGGDGTILAAADLARTHDVPLLGVNMGHMGFLAEVSGEGIPKVIEQLARNDYRVDTRMTLDVTVRFPDGSEVHDWALNEAVLIHTDVAHPVQLALVVDGQDVSTYGADGIILATPTGSTAYSFSAGGPVVWPDTEAIVISPLAAHGLFTRPLVVGPSSVVEVIVLEHDWSAPEMWCDGLRQTTAPVGTSIITRVGQRPVRLVRLDDTPFSTRLVHKFHLPVRGWRQRQENRSHQDTELLGEHNQRTGAHG
ncbi:NAD kinase [Schaalia canis]|uniref:NAD kinase n=1 Tax=Schaalia canis TaxID=100469 RepID=A0A3P1SHU2_9ACTO|nr:NAD kinase [Schaalia canis]RRC96530.1 NAD kinase [Schaalia canis]